MLLVVKEMIGEGGGSGGSPWVQTEDKSITLWDKWISGPRRITREKPLKAKSKIKRAYMYQRPRFGNV